MTEPGIGSVTVLLLDDMGNVVATTMTLPDGTYAFTNLVPGMYTVQQIDLPGFISTTANLVPVNLPVGGMATVNFGDVQPPDLTLEKTLQGALTFELGGTYLLRVTNIGDGPTFAPITVTDPIPMGLMLVSASGNGWNCTTSTATNLQCIRTAVLLAHQAAPVITLRVRVNPGFTGVIENLATVSTALDNDSSNDSSSAATRPIHSAPAPLLSPEGFAGLFAALLLVAALGVRRLRAGAVNDRRGR